MIKTSSEISRRYLSRNTNLTVILYMIKSYVNEESLHVLVSVSLLFTSEKQNWARKMVMEWHRTQVFLWRLRFHCFQWKHSVHSVQNISLQIFVKAAVLGKYVHISRCVFYLSDTVMTMFQTLLMNFYYFRLLILIRI